MLDDRDSPFGFIIFCLVIGVFLIFIPWHVLWESNFLVQHVPVVRRVMLSGYFRGAVSGLGAVDVVFGLVAFARLIRSARSSSADPSIAESRSADHPE